MVCCKVCNQAQKTAVPSYSATSSLYVRISQVAMLVPNTPNNQIPNQIEWKSFGNQTRLFATSFFRENNPFDISYLRGPLSETKEFSYLLWLSIANRRHQTKCTFFLRLRCAFPLSYHLPSCENSVHFPSFAGHHAVSQSPCQHL